MLPTVEEVCRPQKTYWSTSRRFLPVRRFATARRSPLWEKWVTSKAWSRHRNMGHLSLTISVSTTWRSSKCPPVPHDLNICNISTRWLGRFPAHCQIPHPRPETNFSREVEVVRHVPPTRSTHPLKVQGNTGLDIFPPSPFCTTHSPCSKALHSPA